MFIYLVAILLLIYVFNVYLSRGYGRIRHVRKKADVRVDLKDYPLRNNICSTLESRNQTNLIQLRILNDKVSKVTELNEELELCRTFDNSPISVTLIDKILEITLLDDSTCSIEKLVSLEYIKGNVQVCHLKSLKKLFIKHGGTNYLLALEIYKLTKSSPESDEKIALLNFIVRHVELPA
jgi:hypothetical protein